MKHYSIQAIHGSITSENPIVEAENSKKALVKWLGKKMENAIIKKNEDSNVSVVECDEEGRLHYDRRKWNYYGVYEQK